MAAVTDEGVVAQVVQALVTFGEVKTDVAVIRALLEKMDKAQADHESADEIVHKDHERRLVSLETDRKVNKASDAVNLRWVSVLSAGIGAVGGIVGAILTYFLRGATH